MPEHPLIEECETDGANIRDALDLVEDTTQPMTADMTALSANTNDWAMTSAKTVYGSSTTSVNITGIVAGFDGEWRRFVNTGSNPMVFKHDDSASTAANRLISSSEADKTVGANEGIWLNYQGGSVNRWRAF
jgi:hypothetical protein